MKKILIVLAIAFGAYAAHQKGLFQKPLPPRATSSTGAAEEGDPCKEKQFCAVVYMAPWCPHCKNAVADLQGFARKSAAKAMPGVKVWVGAGEPAANKAMADAFGVHGFVDADESVAKKFSVRGFPSFYVLDREGDVILRDGEAYQWVHEKFN